MSMLRNSLFSLAVFCLFGLQAWLKRQLIQILLRPTLCCSWLPMLIPKAVLKTRQHCTKAGIGQLRYFGQSIANLGNAYYKSGSVAPAILNYERAFAAQSGDPDAI